MNHCDEVVWIKEPADVSAGSQSLAVQMAV
jgi:hypothetical protein